MASERTPSAIKHNRATAHAPNKRAVRHDLAHALWARIVLHCAEGWSNGEVADALGVNRATVGKWRRRFIENDIDGLIDAPRPGTLRTISDEDVERVIAIELENSPRGATHWSTRSMACQLHIAARSRRSPSPNVYLSQFDGAMVFAPGIDIYLVLTRS